LLQIVGMRSSYQDEDLKISFVCSSSTFEGWYWISVLVRWNQIPDIDRNHFGPHICSGYQGRESHLPLGHLEWEPWIY